MVQHVYFQAEQSLGAIEHELKRLGLWQAEAPADEALASSAPFCCDTLSFAQWLQFIFLPRMAGMVEARAPLPTAIAIAPMAEETLPAGCEALIEQLRAFDLLLTAGA